MIGAKNIWLISIKFAFVPDAHNNAGEKKKNPRPNDSQSVCMMKPFLSRKKNCKCGIKDEENESENEKVPIRPQYFKSMKHFLHGGKSNRVDD